MASGDEIARLEMAKRMAELDPNEIRIENLLVAFRSNGPETARCVQELVDAAYQAGRLAHQLATARASSASNRFHAIDAALVRLKDAVKRFNPQADD